MLCVVCCMLCSVLCWGVYVRSFLFFFTFPFFPLIQEKRNRGLPFLGSSPPSLFGLSPSPLFLASFCCLPSKASSHVLSLSLSLLLNFFSCFVCPPHTPAPQQSKSLFCPREDIYSASMRNSHPINKKHLDQVHTPQFSLHKWGFSHIETLKKDCTSYVSIHTTS